MAGVAFDMAEDSENAEELDYALPNEKYRRLWGLGGSRLVSGENSSEEEEKLSHCRT
jgi:hypothetical protein